MQPREPIECKALDLASDLVKQGRISRAEAEIIRELAKVSSRRFSAADRDAFDDMATKLDEPSERVTYAIASVGTQL
ncbi:MAG: hypothetical protein EOO23_04555 [Comamonadaceae bacterium]|nr:MAG: hypothetical protein EOO23_04555 [Comamonadaceae bacterium]